MKGLASVSLAGLLLGGCASTVQSAAVTPAPPSTFVVFFPRGDASLTPASRAIVDRAAAVIQAAHPEEVIVAAGGSTSGSISLSGARAFSVRQALSQDGVSEDLMARANLETVNLATSDTAEQRVEIRLVRQAPELARSRGLGRVSDSF